MSRWERALELAELPPGAGREVLCGQRLVALYHVDGRVVALDGVCPHQGGPLGKGQLTGRVVTCPWHGWQFDVTTGRHQLSATLCQPSLPVKLEAGVIFVDVADSTDPRPEG